MTAAALDLLQAVSAAGGLIRLEGDTLQLAAPEPLPEELRARLRQHKAEIVALLQVPGVSRALDPVALDDVIALGYVPDPATIYRDIRQLPPAHCLILRRGEAARPVHWQALALAVGAGLAFGLFFVVVGSAGEGAGIWPLVGARAASISLFAGLGAARITAAAPPRGAIGAIVACGVLDSSANVFYLLALDHGLMSVVAVLTALYPAGTVLLARYVLGEQLSPIQRAGLGVAGLAAVLIAY